MSWTTVFDSAVSGEYAETLTYSYTMQGALKNLRSTVSGTNYYLVEHAEYDPAGRTERLYLGAASLGATPVLVSDDGYYPWTQQGGRLQYSRSGVYNDPTSLQSLEYDYDPNGNLDYIKDYKAGVDASHPQQQTFDYDNLDRLISAQATSGSGGNGNYGPESYNYLTSSGNLSSKGGTSLGYGAQSAGCADGALNKPHAAITYGSNSYCYDLNGNQVKRNIGGSVYALAYDAENRLTGVNGAATATFVYDGDERRVRATVSGVTTVYVGDYLEWTGSTSTMVKYYYAGGARIAMRVGTGSGTTGLSWLLSDHLGSTAITADGSGNKVAELRYKSWGETRFSSGTTPTKRQYTGQISEMATICLYYYGARWYDPKILQFNQADTVSPRVNAYGADYDLIRVALTVGYSHPIMVAQLGKLYRDRMQGNVDESASHSKRHDQRSAQTTYINPIERQKDQEEFSQSSPDWELRNFQIFNRIGKVENGSQQENKTMPSGPEKPETHRVLHLNLIGLNRYSYALNCPTRYTGPSGNAECDVTQAIAGGGIVLLGSVIGLLGVSLAAEGLVTLSAGSVTVVGVFIGFHSLGVGIFMAGAGKEIISSGIKAIGKSDCIPTRK